MQVFQVWCELVKGSAYSPGLSGLDNRRDKWLEEESNKHQEESRVGNKYNIKINKKE